jgi:tRNA-dihydrouridine synthase B
MITIGPHKLRNQVILAPMAGITDQPFRDLCYSMNAALCVSEMIASKSQLHNTQKSLSRIPSSNNNTDLRCIQLVGVDATTLALAAQHYADQGAQMIDINMGCPAKKVLKKSAGSAILKDLNLVKDICSKVVQAVDIPVTLKIRTGWCTQSRNAIQVAQIAQSQGIKMLTIHGRTRACRFKGNAEYDSIRRVKESLYIPVIANGDITTPEQARDILKYTCADGVMIGRGAQGNPWLINRAQHFLSTGDLLPLPSHKEILSVMISHIQACSLHYGEEKGYKIARKHAHYYFSNWFSNHLILRRQFNQLNSFEEQLYFLKHLTTIDPITSYEIAA